MRTRSQNVMHDMAGKAEYLVRKARNETESDLILVHRMKFPDGNLEIKGTILATLLAEDWSKRAIGV